LTFASSLAGWIELAFLRGRLRRRIGPTGGLLPLAAKLLGFAGAGAAVALLVKLSLSPQQPILTAVSMLMPYGIVYLGLSIWWKVPESQAIIGRLTRIVRKAAE
jgi:hypothetical protein